MSKNKSNQLARFAGGHKVFQPEISKDITETEKQKRIKFVNLSSGEKSINSIVDSFYKILTTFEANPKVVDEVSKRTKLSKRETVSRLTFYKKEYEDVYEIRDLLYKVW
jgi:hypothetical protein